jgi:hypothetical protein
MLAGWAGLVLDSACIVHHVAVPVLPLMCDSASVTQACMCVQRTVPCGALRITCNHLGRCARFGGFGMLCPVPGYDVSLG